MSYYQIELQEHLRHALTKDRFSPLLTETLAFFLHNPHESLVVVDREGKVEFMDRRSEKFFGFARGESKGRKITEIVPDSIFPRVIETGAAIVGDIRNLQGKYSIASSFPLVKDGEIIGAVGHVIFDSLQEIKRLHNEISVLKAQVEYVKEAQRMQHRAHYTFEDIIGNGEGMKRAVELAKRAALLGQDVLITGESGTGKELIAQAIHNFSSPDKPFVRVNSPAIPFDLAEAELFGYEKGAFSGASREGKPGKFELADQGTILLDEISSMPLSIQAKILCVLQERECERVGGSKVIKLNLRVISATNVDLKRMVSQGKFREDLYYRLARFQIDLPPLRERRGDIPIYAEHFLGAINRQFGTRFTRFCKGSRSWLESYDWPGNVRELISVLEQAVLKTWDGEEIPLRSLPERPLTHCTQGGPLKKELQETERDLLLKALKQATGNKRKAASLLGMPRSTFYKKIKEYGIGGLA
jgi:sigma-54 dependent transcriptional regulator, acetoin dehydrogenase operon transcriptional activator AcoR